MKETITHIIKKITADFTEEKLHDSFRNIGIDSIDLITIRVEIENLFGKAFSEEKWFSFATPTDIVDFLKKNKSMLILKSKIPKNAFEIQRTIEVNMPQMANAGLSENWLFKEIGDIHWKGICDGLQTTSSDLVDKFGDRLYATFIAISITYKPLIEFKENQVLQFKGKVDRYGDNIYRTRIIGNNNLRAELLTSFTKRGDKGNSVLQKSVPSGTKNDIKEIALPPFLQEYKLVRKKLVEEIVVAKRKFQLSAESFFEIIHSIIPCYEINGVGLLYFAAYPIISDIGELAYLKTIKNADKPEIAYFTIARKVFYFANCDSTDSVIYQLNSFEEEGSYIKIQSSLYRQSDRKLMAKIFTVKKINK